MMLDSGWASLSSLNPAALSLLWQGGRESF